MQQLLFGIIIDKKGIRGRNINVIMPLISLENKDGVACVLDFCLRQLFGQSESLVVNMKVIAIVY